MAIKSRQLREVEQRCQRVVDELDQFRYKIQDLSKENTEMKLKIDVQQSTIDGLSSEIKHSTIELKETKDLLQIYEAKCEDLIKQLTAANAELNGNKREMISFSQTKEEKDTKIDQLKSDLRTAQMASEDFRMKLGTLTIHSDK